MKHVLWAASDADHACRLAQMTGYSDTWKIDDGLQVAAEFPADVALAMDPDFPDDTVLTDCLLNMNQLVIVSQRVRDFLQPQTGADVEFLPVAVHDHKGKKVKGAYFIVNPNVVVPALKLDECEATMHSLDSDSIRKMSALVLDDAILGKAPPVFRVKHMATYLWVRSDLAKALGAQGFEGNRWIEPSAVANGRRLSDLSSMDTDADATV